MKWTENVKISEKSKEFFKKRPPANFDHEKEKTTKSSIYMYTFFFRAIWQLKIVQSS
jgi:hypothetical protein